MDPEGRRKELRKLAGELVTAYAAVIAVLARLPVPMTLPAWEENGSPLAVRSLDRAWELAGWEPLDARAVGRVRDMITGWVTAHEMTVLAGTAGPAPWRLRAIESALLTCDARVYQVGRHLDWLADPNGRKP